MYYNIICFENQAMFVPAKIDRYYGVTTDLIFVLLDNKMKKSRNRCISTASRLFHGRSDGIRTHGLLVPNQARYQTSPHPEVL